MPFTHLVDQWREECHQFGYNEVLECYGDKKSWVYRLESVVNRFNQGFVDKVVVISVYRSSSKKEFISNLGLVKRNSFLIADECHYFGTTTYLHDGYNFFESRLGLSATPQRWWDKEGTQHILNYFGKVVYQYSIGEAIEKGALSKYEYYPVTVSLSETEYEKYRDITKKIGNLLDSEEEEDIEMLKQLRIKRMQIVKQCQMKKERLNELLSDLDDLNRSHILVYCAPSEIIEVCNLVYEQGFTVSRFDHMISTKARLKILDQFDKGAIQVLVAIKCLDEGVDVPSTKTAFFLASTSNPKEFIQRRGRVLRKSANKTVSTIYDFVVMGVEDQTDFLYEIAVKELPRVSEFSEYAINMYSSRKELWELLNEYNYEYLLDIKPWDIYQKYDIERSIGHGG